MQIARDWINIKNDLLDRCCDPSGDQAVLAGKLERMRDLIDGCEEGEAKIQAALFNARRVAKSSGAVGKAQLAEECEQLERDWQAYQARLAQGNERLQQGIEHWQQVDESQEKLSQWLREKERALKDYTPKSTLEEKEDQLHKLEVGAFHQHAHMC